MSETVQSIDRALNLLEILSDHDKGLGLIDLSERSGLSKSTVHRLLNTLSENGYVKQSEESGKYLLTMKLFHLGSKNVEKMDILKLSRPYLEKLRDLSSEVVHLVLRDGNEIVYIDKVESENTIRMYSNIGKKGTLYSTSVGKAIMAYHSDEEIRKIWESLKIEKLTEYTLTDFNAFMKEINEIRKVGYAMDREENELGVKCLGAAILDYTKKPIAAISVSGPIQRMTDEKVSVLVRNILETKKLVSKELGCYL
ncbi:MAG: IclR family transcriptional regulator [Clostridiaceae bacterium]